MIDFNSNKTIRTIFSDTGLTMLFQKKFHMDLTQALATRSPEVKSYLRDVFNLILTTPRLLDKYNSTIIPKTKQKKKKRLTLKEINKRIELRGYQTENDRAMIHVNRLENLVAQLQRRGQSELLNDSEARIVISSVRLFERKINKILNKSKKKSK